MIVLAGSFRIPPESLAEAVAEMQQVIAASRAETGCLAYEYGADPFDSGRFIVSEQWTDRESLNAHFTTTHMRHWQERRAALGFCDREITLYETGAGEAV